MTTIGADRLECLKGMTLLSGKHNSFADGVCAMEAVAWLADEPHSDMPACTCPVIAGMIRSWNDLLPDADRTRLILPLLPKLVGTYVKSDNVLLKRMYLVQDWNIRVRTPMFLRLAGLENEAKSLAELGEIVDDASLHAATALTSAARSAADSAARSAADSAARSAADSAARSAADSAAYYAARSATYSAARSATYYAARSATYSAARSAADSAARSAADSAARFAAYYAARSAAHSAADSAAYYAARSAAYYAADSALTQTVADVQASFVALIVKLCEVTE